MKNYKYTKHYSKFTSIKLKYCGENLLLKTNHAVRLLGYIMFRIIYYNFD